MKIGINLMLWTDDPTAAATRPLYAQIRDWGFDGVELPIFAHDTDAFRELGAHLDDLGLERTAVTILNPETDAISADAAVRSAAVQHLKDTIECCEAVGADLLCGPLYAALGQFSGAPPTDEEHRRSVACLKEAAAFAAERGIDLALEFLNRFEIYLLNDADSTRRFAEATGAANLGVHYDTFHAHIEEKDPAAAIAACGERLRHVHISENDRSTPGRGQVRWQESFDALADAGYDGWLTIEAFGSALPSIAAATKIWRPMFESEEQLARDGLAFIRREWAARRGDSR